jgi:hypothetical protein
MLNELETKLLLSMIRTPADALEFFRQCDELQVYWRRCRPLVAVKGLQALKNLPLPPHGANGVFILGCVWNHERTI